MIHTQIHHRSIELFAEIPVLKILYIFSTFFLYCHIFSRTEGKKSLLTELRGPGQPFGYWTMWLSTSAKTQATC